MMETRRRNLVILGSAALVSLALAAFALEQRAAQGQPHYTPTEVLPGFAANVKNAAMIHIASQDGEFDVAYTPDKGWVLPARGNFPADFDEVRHTLIGLATLETIAPRTGRADWMHYLSLDAPPQGSGIAFTVKDKDGKFPASLIAGHMEELGDPNGTSGLFVRRPDDNQAWLARAVFVPHGDIASWLSSKVLSLGGTRLQEVAVTPLKGPAFTISRPSAAAQIYTLANAPKNSTPNSQIINSFPFAIANFTFTDVRTAAPAEFAKTAHAIARTFDGLLVTFDVVQQGSDIWTRISASTVPGAKPEIAQQASAINARTAGFAFKLPPEKGNALLADLPKIMTPPPAPPQQPGLPPQFLGGGMAP
jgi:Domain of unknown function (DUF4340)